MNSTKSHLILASAFLLLFAAPACFADLMCYVCDDCQKVNKDTPLLACNDDFFNQGGSTEASTVTTTEATTTEEVTTTSEMTTTSIPETTAIATDPTTEEPTTTEQTTTAIPESTESTDAPIPTPATVGPPETTTGVPTPPAQDLNREVTRLLPSDTQFPVRQRRAVIDTGISYHCYTVKKTFNNTVQTERGCSRVLPTQGVCKDLELQNASVQLSNCDPCTMDACNSATSVMQSTFLASFIVVLVAAVFQNN